MATDRALLYDRLVEEAGGLGDSHLWLLRHVPAGARVLDCGCAGGYLARVLVRAGCSVDGVELESAAAELARPLCREVFVGSLEDPVLLASLAGPYDRILFGDVLEHLRNPEAVLGRVRRVLAPGGRVLISLPNVANWKIRWDLLRGRFEYQDSGLLDRTHLRFYTYRSAQGLVQAAGFRIVAQDLTHTLPRTRLGGLIARHLVRTRPNLFAHQTLLELEPCPE
jgi:2-polyprenyl-3-methyl-5-hydroxy-6-metoxy-1,4-benzoquinol methylase